MQSLKLGETYKVVRKIWKYKKGLLSYSTIRSVLCESGFSKFCEDRRNIVT